MMKDEVNEGGWCYRLNEVEKDGCLGLDLSCSMVTLSWCSSFKNIYQWQYEIRRATVLKERKKFTQWLYEEKRGAI